jgi:hypothetical protein
LKKFDLKAEPIEIIEEGNSESFKMVAGGRDKSETFKMIGGSFKPDTNLNETELSTYSHKNSSEE